MKLITKIVVETTGLNKQILQLEIFLRIKKMSMN